MTSLLLLAWAAVDARMYQWTNPVTGTSQFSGTPPSWYRSEHPGPRVLVFDGGTLIDDTSLPVPPERSDALRRAAFEEVEKRKELQALQRLQEAAQREAQEQEQKETESPEKTGAPAEEGQRAETGDALDAEAIERLKAIIAEFDRRGGAASLRAKPAPGSP